MPGPAGNLQRGGVGRGSLTSQAPRRSSLLEGLVEWNSGRETIIRGVIPTSGSFTYAVWIRPQDFLDISYWLSGGMRGAPDRHALYTAPDGLVYWTPDKGKTLLSYAALHATWNHVVGVYDDAALNACLYVDGVMVASCPAKVLSYGDALAFGGSVNGGYPMRGCWRSAGVWARVLSDGGATIGVATRGEVAELYNEGRDLDYPFTK